MLLKEKVSQLATLVTGFVMAGCCLGPLILIPFGLTGFAGGLAIYATKNQPLLIIVTFILLVYSFYTVVFDDAKTSLDAIQQSVLELGYGVK